MTISQILIAFSDECKEFIPKKIDRLNKDILPYKKWIEDTLRNDKYSNFEKFFIIESSKIIYSGITKKINYLEKLKKIRKLMNKSRENDIIDEDIQKAREYPLKFLLGKEKNKKYQCPFHVEKTPSLHLNKDNSFYCFGCHERGDSIQFIMKLNNMNFIEAIKYINSL